jgi:hypothetical protein
VFHFVPLSCKNAFDLRGSLIGCLSLAIREPLYGLSQRFTLESFINSFTIVPFCVGFEQGKEICMKSNTHVSALIRAPRVRNLSD